MTLLAEETTELTPISQLEPILVCVDQGFRWFGQNVQKEIYTKLRWDFGFSRQDIPVRPEVFFKCLEKFLGPGSKCVERAVLQELKSEFQLKDMKATDVIGAIQRVKQQLLSNSGDHRNPIARRNELR